MTRLRIVGLALVAIFALAAVSASAASAHTFKAKPTKKVFPVGIQGSATTTQTFTSGFGKVECTKAAATGSASKEAEETTKQVVDYTGCTSTLGAVAEPIEAHYLFAANGTENAEKRLEEVVTVEKPITISFTGAGCSIKIFATGEEGQKKLGGIKYENNAAKTELTVNSKTTKIKEKGSGGLCVFGGTEGTYTGSVKGKFAGGETGELFWE